MTRTGGGLLVVLAVAGCASPDGGAMAWQRDYANSIPDPQARATALGSVAMSAAYLGDGRSCRAALADLKGDPQHDEYARKCAVELNKAGHPDDARRVAKRITDKALRQTTLEELVPKPEEPADPPEHLPPERLHGGII